MKKYLLIIVLLLFVFSTSANAGMDEQVEFVFEMTGYMESSTALISEVDLLNTRSITNARNGTFNLIALVSAMKLPDENTPIYDVMQYTYLSALECSYESLDTNLSLEQRIEAGEDGVQYLLILGAINEDVLDIITH